MITLISVGCTRNRLGTHSYIGDGIRICLGETVAIEATNVEAMDQEPQKKEQEVKNELKK